MKWSKPNNRRIDPEIRSLVESVNHISFITTVGSCCGHGKYHPTIVVKTSDNGYFYEFISDTAILRTKRFYVKDKNGYYYIPEVEQNYKDLLKECHKK